MKKLIHGAAFIYIMTAFIGIVIPALWILGILSFCYMSTIALFLANANRDNSHVYHFPLVVKLEKNVSEKRKRR